MFLDLDSQEMSFSLNGEHMGIAFSGFHRNKRSNMYPALTAYEYQSCTVNLGNKPFLYVFSHLEKFFLSVKI